MDVRCSECGGVTAWDDDAASAICTTCGTMIDPSQLILSSHGDQDQPYNPAVPSTGLRDHAAPTILKSFRTGPNWNLAGQGTKEVRDRKNSFAMAGFINSLAHSLNASGLSPRATNIHAQAMRAGHFRWGRKAKLVAGACLAIALRESKRPDSLHDIAFLLNESFPILTRTLTTVITALKLNPPTSDASIHIPPLQIHLTSALAEGTLELPPALIAQLKAVSLRAAVNVSTALCTLLNRLGPNHHINSLPGPSTSCAVFLLGLESEARAPLAHIGDLATYLAPRCHTSRSVVMGRYKLVQDEVALLIEKVPWLDKYESKKGRAKIAKRVIVARGLADVVQFQNEIWSQVVKPTVVMETSDGEDGEKDEFEDKEAGGSSREPPLLRSPSEQRIGREAPRKRRKTKHDPLREAAAFLVDPLSAPIPPSTPTRKPAWPDTSPPSNDLPTASGHPPNSDASASSLATPTTPTIAGTRTPAPSSTITPYFPLTSYILGLPTHTVLISSRPPTRLQLLLASRGGTESGIGDEELFGDGELEGMFRSEEQVGELRVLFGWMEGGGEDGIGEEAEEGVISRRRRDNAGGGDGEPREQPTRRKKSRVNLEALAKFLEDPEDGKDDAEYGYDEAFRGCELFDEEGGGEEEVGPSTPPPQNGYSGAAGGEVVVDEWRPLSPEVGLGYRHGAAGYYDEEYD